MQTNWQLFITWYRRTTISFAAVSLSLIVLNLILLEVLDKLHAVLAGLLIFSTTVSVFLVPIAVLYRIGTRPKEAVQIAKVTLQSGTDTARVLNKHIQPVALGFLRKAADAMRMERPATEWKEPTTLRTILSKTWQASDISKKSTLELANTGMAKAVKFGPAIVLNLFHLAILLSAANAISIIFSGELFFDMTVKTALAVGLGFPFTTVFLVAVQTRYDVGRPADCCSEFLHDFSRFILICSSILAVVFVGRLAYALGLEKSGWLVRLIPYWVIPTYLAALGESFAIHLLGMYAECTEKGPPPLPEQTQ
jgi:hypothetical protein